MILDSDNKIQSQLSELRLVVDVMKCFIRNTYGHTKTKQDDYEVGYQVRSYLTSNKTLIRELKQIIKDKNNIELRNITALFTDRQFQWGRSIQYCSVSIQHYYDSSYLLCCGDKDFFRSLRILNQY